jgi:hypothetical protein
MPAFRFLQFALAPVLVTAGLALAQPAAAADYCVVGQNDPCSGTKMLDLQSALNAAAVDTAPDRIFLAAGTYIAPAQGFIYDPLPAGPVEIIGAGQGDTTLKGTSGAFRTLAVFGGSATKVHDLRVEMPPSAPVGAQAFRTNGVVEHVTVTEDTAQQGQNYRIGVALVDSGVLDDSVVALTDDQPTTGVQTMGGGTVRRGAVYASTGIDSRGGVIDRARVGATGAGVRITHGTTKITSARITSSDDGSVGIAAESIDANASVDVDSVTLIGPGEGANSGSGLDVGNTYTPSASIDFALRNTIIRGYPHTFWIGSNDLGSGHVNFAASYSDYDSSKETVVGSKTSFTEDHISYVGNAGFDNEGEFDFIPEPGSPLIDAGDPTTPQGLDAYDKPLVTDGDGDGIARRDIGAAELPGQPLRVVPGDVPPPADGNQVGQSAGGAGVVPGRDTSAPALSGLSLSHKVFAVGRARTAIAARTARGTRFAYALSENAKVVVKVQRVATKRTVGKLTRSAKGGRNTIAFSGRIGTKALKPGRYRAVMTATDAAGNRSAAKSLSFRIAKR